MAAIIGAPPSADHGFTPAPSAPPTNYPLAESRFRWTGLDRVTETPEVSYIMFGKIQAITIPKDAMTGEQRAELATFVNGLKTTGS